MPTYYAQHREDQWISEYLPLPDKGFYVDIGCAHPFTQSNTAFLRDRKWDGLAIDGNPNWIDDWKGIPVFHCAIISEEPQVLFFEDTYWSHISPCCGKPRKSETIEQFLERFGVGKIDFMSLDTEGTEFEILQSFDFERHDPSIVIVEYNAGHFPVIGPHQSPLPDFMRSKGYELPFIFPPVNMIFCK